jgi:molybdopterin-guanine dinucleotide biosynthesis protein A
MFSTTFGGSRRTGMRTEIERPGSKLSDASIEKMRIQMPAAVLAGGASRRMGRPKAELPYGAGTLLAHQAGRLSLVFAEVFAVVKEPSRLPAGPALVLLDGSPEHAAIHGLTRALEEVQDRVFVLAVDLPVLPESLMRAIAQRALASEAPAVVPRAEGRLQPLAAVWRKSALPAAQARIERGELSLSGLAEEVGAEVFPEEECRRADPSGNAFANLNTLEDYLAHRERA